MEDSEVEKGKIVRAQRAAEKQALALRMRRAITEAEALLWERLRNNHLGGLHFRRQQVIAGFIADFYCRASRLIVECDGAVHKHQQEYDQERNKILSTHNLRVLRFTNDSIQNDMSGVLKNILTASLSNIITKPAS